MGFPWLDAAGAALTGLGIVRNLQGPEQPASLPYLEEAARRARDIEIALTRPDLGKFRGLMDAERDTINRDTAQSLRDLMEADRAMRTRSASGLGVFQDDRRDETVAREYIRSRETAQDRARTKTRDYLMGALEANKVSMGGFADTGALQYATAADQFGRESRAFEGIATTLPKLRGLFDALNGGGRSSSGPVTTGMLNGAPTRFNVNPHPFSGYRTPFTVN